MYQLERGEECHFNLAENRPAVFALKIVQAVILTGGLLAAGEKTLIQDSDQAPSALSVEEASAYHPIEEAETTSRTLPNTTTTLQKVEVVVLPATATTTTLPPPTTTTTTMAPTTTTTEAPPQAVPRADEPAPQPQPRLRSREQRCRDAIAAAKVTPAPGYFLVCGPDYNSSQDGYTCPNTNYTQDPNYKPLSCGDDAMHPGDIMQPGETRIHPDDSDSDDTWAFTVKHEIGHGWCVHEQRDQSEECADSWAYNH